MAFYLDISPHLPPTPSHPEPSPCLAYLHAYSLVCTRAFLIDLYHTIALCPFADLFNHSSLTPHSSLLSDEFVCHQCGSLPPCSHDIPSTTGVVRRLEHLPGSERTRLEKEVDSVEMRVERRVRKGEEVMNCYGDGIGDGRLLVEWGFVGEEFWGDGLVWDEEELGADEVVREVWRKIVTQDRVTFLDGKAYDTGNDTANDTANEGDRLIRLPDVGRFLTMNLSQSGEVSLALFGYLCLITHHTTIGMIDDAGTSIVKATKEVETTWTRLQDDADVLDASIEVSLSPGTILVVRAVLRLFEQRLRRMYRSDIGLDELFERRDVSSLHLRS